MTMKVFVSGGCGQIGSHICEMLLDRGDEVMALDNMETGRRIHLPEDHRGLTFVEGSIADPELVGRLMSDFRPDSVVHTAASYKNPDDWYSDTLTNSVGGANLVRASLDNDVSRFVYFQTALCYGVRPIQSPIRLDHPIDPSNSSYSISKTTTEQYLELSGLNYVTFRLANVIGPRNVSGPLPIFFRRLSEGTQCVVTKARRDFVYSKDLCRAAVDAVDGCGQGAYHFSSGKDVAIKELYDAVVSAMRINDYPEPEIRDLTPDDAESILLDPSRTLEDFGNVQFTPLNAIVKDAVDYYEKYGVSGGYSHLKLND